MKIFQSILFYLIPLIAWTQTDLPEEFEFDGGITGIHLQLLEDSTFILRTGDCEGIVDFKGTFVYHQDTLLLTKTDWEWYVEPVELQPRTLGETTVPHEPILFGNYLRKGDDLYLIIDNELIEPNHLEKIEKKN